MNKAVKIGIGLLALVAVGALAFSIMSSRGVFTPEDETVKAEPISGKIGCLPLKDGTTPPDDCALGLRNDRGMYLELQDLGTQKLAVDQQVEVTGDMKPPSENSKYNAVGVVKVTKVTLQ